MATTLKEVIIASKNIETLNKEKGMEKVEDGERMKLDNSSRPDKKSKSSKSKHQKLESDITRWSNKSKKKHFRECIEGVTSYKYMKTSRNANECMAKKEVCFKCGEEGQFKQDCPKKEGTVRMNAPLNPRWRAYFVGLDEATRGRDFGAACLVYLRDGDKKIGLSYVTY